VINNLWHVQADSQITENSESSTVYFTRSVSRKHEHTYKFIDGVMSCFGVVICKQYMTRHVVARHGRDEGKPRRWPHSTVATDLYVADQIRWMNKATKNGKGTTSLFQRFNIRIADMHVCLVDLYNYATKFDGIAGDPPASNAHVYVDHYFKCANRLFTHMCDKYILTPMNTMCIYLACFVISYKFLYDRWTSGLVMRDHLSQIKIGQWSRVRGAVTHVLMCIEWRVWAHINENENIGTTEAANNGERGRAARAAVAAPIDVDGWSLAGALVSSG
jgi:hypothetical protein